MGVLLLLQNWLKGLSSRRHTCLKKLGFGSSGIYKAVFRNLKFGF